MASTSPPAERRDPHLLLRLLLAIVLVPLLIVGAGTAMGAGIAPLVQPLADFTHRVDTEVLDFEPLGDLLSGYVQNERSVVLDATGNELAILRAVNRELVDIEDIPAHVQNAVLATEDQSFRDHRGVNWRAIGRAALGNIRAGDIESGASTITQQLVKLLTGDAETTIQRKLREAVYAIELEKRATKDEILEIYMNEAYLANQVYGFGTAAEYYFSKDIAELDIGEAAMLAGMLRAPNANDPLTNPRNALARRNIVVNQMADAGFITELEALGFVLPEPTPEMTDEQVIDALGLRLSPIPEVEEPFFVNYVRTLLREVEALGVDEEARERYVLNGGLTIRTTIDPQMQDIAQNAIRSVLSDPDGIQSALASVEPDTGRIIAIGFGPKEFGSGPGQTEVLPAVPGVGSSFGRQPGSSFKAFGIVAALEAGVTPTYTVNTPSPYTPRRHCANSGWRPGNYSDGGGGTLNMARATAISSNVYFAHLVDEFTGPDGLADTATRMGIVNTDLFDVGGSGQPVCSTILGAAEVYPLDMASGFGTMAASGVRCEPYAITEILNADGEVIYEGGTDNCEQAISPDIANAATSLLRGPIEGGTASRNGRIGRPAAGKTGTTQDWRDAWFVGFIPQVSTAVWVGNEIPETMLDSRCGRVTGGCLPTMIWAQFMRDVIAARDLPVEDFPPPPRFPSSLIPDVTGLQQEDAITILAQEEYVGEATTVTDWRPEGTVIEQNPPGGSEAPKGTTVVLGVSDGNGERPVVPDVVGLSVEEARAILQELGITVVVSEVPVDDPEQIGFVVAQRPEGGQLVLEVPGDDPATPGIGEVIIEVGRERTEDDPPPESETPTPDPSASPSATPTPTAEPVERPGGDDGDGDDGGSDEPTEAPTGDGGGSEGDSGDGADGGGDGTDGEPATEPEDEPGPVQRPDDG